MGVDSTRKQGLIGLIWQILLFAVSSFFLCGVLPYQLFNGRFKASHILFVFFWIWVWHSAYKKLFPKKDAPTIEQPEIPQSHSPLSHSAAQTSPIEITHIITHINEPIYERKQVMAKNVLEIDDGSFEAEVLQERTPVLVDFWAPWSQPCRVIGPVVEELSVKYGDKIKFKKCNVDDNPITSSQYGIISVPTLFFFKDGKVFNQVVGTVAKSKLEDMINNVLVCAGLSTEVQVRHQFDQTACPNEQATDISKLKNLLDLGLITQEHFEKRKAEI
jgi:thioredoxin 1